MEENQEKTNELEVEGRKSKEEERRKAGKHGRSDRRDIFLGWREFVLRRKCPRVTSVAPFGILMFSCCWGFLHCGERWRGSGRDEGWKRGKEKLKWACCGRRGNERDTRWKKGKETLKWA